MAGCSLGGCIAVNCMTRVPGVFKGAILFAPMLSLERASHHGLNYYLRHETDHIASDACAIALGYLFTGLWLCLQTTRCAVQQDMAHPASSFRDKERHVSCAAGALGLRWGGI